MRAVASIPIGPRRAFEIEAAMAQRRTVLRSEAGNPDNSSPYQATLAVPIVLRGEVLGGLQVSEAGQAREWTEDDLTFHAGRSRPGGTGAGQRPSD